MTHVLALDLGCTKHIAAVAGLDGRWLGEPVREATPASAGGDAAVEVIADTVRRACAMAGVRAEEAEVIGIGAPGPLDRHTGELLAPPQLPWGPRYSFGERLCSRIGVARFAMDNDCTVGGVGEHRFGAARGTRDAVYFGVGTGVGGCVIMDGAVVHGASDNAGELGHIVVRLDEGPRCGCGARGCLEGIASGSGIAAQGRAALLAGAADLAAAGATVDTIDAAQVARLAADGVPTAREIWHGALRCLGAATAVMMSSLSPEVVVIGGGIPERYGEPYLAEVTAAARELAFGPNADHTRIVLAELGSLSVLHGAVAYALDAAGAVAG
jgi:glucokinase